MNKNVFKLTSLALAIHGLGITSIASAQEELALNQLPPVFVSSVVTEKAKAGQPVSSTRITAEQIRRSGYTNLRDVLLKLGQVTVRTPLDGSRSGTVDLRGFGENASANVVFVVDGVKLNDNELTTPRYGSIPVSSIQSIEIIRGGNSVAYGSGASGGVIRITTDAGAAPQGISGDATASYGSFDTQELGGRLRYGFGDWALTASGAKESTNGYRDNSAASRDHGALALDWGHGPYKAGVSFTAEGSKTRFPGSLTPTQFAQNPKQTNSPNDFGKFDRNTVRGYFSGQVGDVDYGLKVSRRTHNSFGSFGGFAVQSEYEQDQISPYLAFHVDAGPGRHAVRVGIDREKSALRGFNIGFLESTALFVEDDWAVNDQWRVNLGSRVERSDQQKVGSAREYSLVAHQAGASYLWNESTTVFAKLARSFRIPNADENAFASQPFLDPQTANEFEAGVRTSLAGGEWNNSVFAMDVDREIFFDPTVGFFGVNTNLDKVRRQGVETSWRGDLGPRDRINASYQYLDATFRAGFLNGGRVPLVSRHNVKVSYEHDWADRWSNEVIVAAQSDQRSGSSLQTRDSDVKVPGFATLDANLRYKGQGYNVVFQVQNLFDRDYYRTRFFSPFSASGIYPEPGRTFSVNVNTTF